MFYCIVSDVLIIQYRAQQCNATQHTVGYTLYAPYGQLQFRNKQCHRAYNETRKWRLPARHGALRAGIND